MCKSIFNIYLIEIADYIFRLILRIINFFYSIEYHSQNDLVWHNSSIIEKIFITLLNSFNSGL